MYLIEHFYLINTEIDGLAIIILLYDTAKNIVFNELRAYQFAPTEAHTKIKKCFLYWASHIVHANERWWGMQDTIFLEQPL